MAHRKNKEKKRKPRRPEGSVSIDETRIDYEEVQKQPSIEWGERIDTGKIIARGGKSAGYVPGATPSR